jgi:hypothetical protein
MAAQELKRLEVKYVRDKAKSSYPTKVDANCRICGGADQLQFHHYVGLTNLWNKFKKKQKIVVTDVEDIEVYRDQFIATHSSELYDNGEMLCKKDHEALHKIYGKSPGLGTAKKQARWVERQREKHGLDI